MRSFQLWIGVVLFSLLFGCSGPFSAGISSANVPTSVSLEPVTPIPITNTPQENSTPTSLPAVDERLAVDPVEITSPTQTIIPTALPTVSPEDWKNFPVIPQVSDRVGEIYLRGIALGNNPQAFSKVGDCGSTPAWFLGDFDRGPNYYRLGAHTYLESVIQEFQGSYARTSLAAKSGFNASSIFTPLWANREQCQPDETPLACEYRNHRPILALIMLGSNDVWHLDSFEPRMRQLIEFSIENGVIPILSTKADNLEKDDSINQTIARLALEYQIPLINYWRAVQPLPDHGLQEDDVHITWGPNRFDDPRVMKAGWPVRNLTTLQTLDVVWRAVSEQVSTKP